MSRIRPFGALSLTLGAFVATACSEHTTAPPPTPSPSVQLPVGVSSVDWQEQARTLVAANNMSPLAAGRAFAALSVAQYRAMKAINALDTAIEIQPDGVGPGGRSTFEARRGAVAGASVVVLSALFPAAAASLEQRVISEGENGPGNVHPDFTRGVSVGRFAGELVMDRVRNDHFTAPWTGTVPTGPGKWIPNGPPAGATFGGVTPYFLDSGSQFRPPPPPAFGSPAFQADLTEIRTLADTRTSAQTASALYWNFPTGSFTPLGYWNLVATEYVQAHGLDELAATRTLALVSAAAMDALIGCWEAKYYYWTLRPSQADPAITLTFGLPNHPSYPSGHSCSSAAAATVLGHLFPDKAAAVNAMVTEAGLSRMYAGIHYRFDIDAGSTLGTAVGLWAIAHADRIE